MIAPNKDYPLHLPGTEMTTEEFLNALEVCKESEHLISIKLPKPWPKTINGFPIAEGEKLPDSEAKDIVKAIKKLKGSWQWP